MKITFTRRYQASPVVQKWADKQEYARSEQLEVSESVGKSLIENGFAVKAESEAKEETAPNTEVRTAAITEAPKQRKTTRRTKKSS